MTDIINYIKSFLTYGNTEAAQRIGYTDNPNEWDHYDLVILPNHHLGKDWVMPDLSPLTREGKFISPDIIYNTAFFISRAEETLTSERDEHDRFSSRNSILGQNSRLQIPLLDEYARWLLKQLDADLPKAGYQHIYLTHDIDILDRYRHLRGAIGGILRGEWQDVWASWSNFRNDPANTFPWMIKTERKVPKAEVIYFIKHTHGWGHDYPQYNLHGKDFRETLKRIQASGATLGTHSSYYGPSKSLDPTLPHRSHFLRCSIETMQKLVALGVKDDFTMGFPDAAGFRLQTTRPVRWFDPISMQLTDLTLHPLTIMDVTLSNDSYMHLTEDEAYFMCQRLFEKVKQNNGELVLLWHNSRFKEGTYHRRLYPKLLKQL